MNNTKVSIIVPTYNVEKYIVPCLESVAQQTYDNIECIVVDDCGKDDSIKKAQEFIDAYNGQMSFIICKRDSNGGLSAARNSGMKVATGDYLYFLDSDDLLYSDSIEKLLGEIGDCDFCVGSYTTFADENITRTFSDRFLNANKYYGRKDVIESYVEGLWPVMAWNKLIKRSFLEENKLYFQEGLIHEDEMWTFQMFKCISSIALSNDATYKYRQRPGSIMTVENPKNRKDMALILRKIVDYCHTSKDEILYPYCQYIYRFVSVSVFSNKVSIKDNKEYYSIISNLPLRMKGHNIWGKLMACCLKHRSILSFYICYLLAGMRKRDLIVIK